MCTNQFISQSKLKINQRGFVLVLALVLLTVLTLIGVSSMNSASIEVKSAANAQQHQIAFNAVVATIEYAISDDVVKGGGTPLLNFQTNSAVAQPVLPHVVANASNLQASLAYVGCLPGAPGSSLEDGKGFGYNLYTLTATGANASGSATSTQIQGVRNLAAACAN